MRKIIVAHVKHPPKGYECIRCDRASVLGNPYEFKNESYRESCIKAYRRWLWENYKLYQEYVKNPIFDLEELDMECIPAEKELLGLKIAEKFKEPSVYQVITELELIAKVANTKGDISLLCWCRGNPKVEDRACHCDVIKSCVEKLFL